MSRSSYYDNSHPHYTPDWLSEVVASYIPKDFQGTVIDPACGSGNLLAAAALRLRELDSACRNNFIGIDVSKEAALACRRTLSSIVPDQNVSVYNRDYLAEPPPSIMPEARVAVLNPPFLGYGAIAVQRRSQIRSSLGMSGRFNLSHAFFVKVVREIKPQLAVAILPSNWHYSASSSFRNSLDGLGGEWHWENVGEAFKGVAADVGVLVWKPARRETIARRVVFRPATSAIEGFEVRQGVATGRDAVFRALAARGFSGGRVVESVVGADVGRNRSTPIWMLSARTYSDSYISDLISRLPDGLRSELAERSSVRAGRKNSLQYHENYPAWFLDEPKLLLPEVVAGALRVEMDALGAKLPLHSVIAVRVPSKVDGRSLLKYLQEPSQRRRLASACPQLASGAFRLNVGVVRAVVAEWRRKQMRRGGR